MPSDRHASWSARCRSAWSSPSSSSAGGRRSSTSPADVGDRATGVAAQGGEQVVDGRRGRSRRGWPRRRRKMRRRSVLDRGRRGVRCVIAAAPPRALQRAALEKPKFLGDNRRLTATATGSARLRASTIGGRQPSLTGTQPDDQLAGRLAAMGERSRMNALAAHAARQTSPARTIAR